MKSKKEVKKVKAKVAPEAKKTKPKARRKPVFCADCDEAIPAARLKAVITDTCINCAEMREKNGNGVLRRTAEFDVISHGEEVEFVDIRIK